MSNRDKYIKSLLSYLRGVVAATGAVVLGAILSPEFDINDLFKAEGLKALAAIAFGAGVKWSLDYLRRSNTDFGLGSAPTVPDDLYEQLEIPFEDE